MHYNYRVFYWKSYRRQCVKEFDKHLSPNICEAFWTNRYVVAYHTWPKCSYIICWRCPWNGAEGSVGEIQLHDVRIHPGYHTYRFDIHFLHRSGEIWRITSNCCCYWTFQFFNWKMNRFELVCSSAKHEARLQVSKALLLFRVNLRKVNDSQQYALLQNITETRQRSPIDKIFGCTFQGFVVRTKRTSGWGKAAPWKEFFKSKITV